MATFSPYLNFAGNTEEAFLFYKSNFGGEFSTLMRFKEMPDGPDLPPNEQDRIMHVSLPIGNGVELMGSDMLESMGHKHIAGSNFYISISVDSRSEADRLFAGLSAGGKVESAMKEEFWGSYFGMFADRFGIRWMISSPL